MPPRAPRLGRRALLATLGASGVGALTGCLGGVSEAGQSEFAQNPVSDGVEDRPRHGRPRSETEITLVEFSDPSCPYCASFHEGTLPRVESEWIEPGRATKYDRWVPVVAPWGEAAMHGLLEAYRRDPAAYETLVAAYYEHQDELATALLPDRTREYLADASVDADAVAEAIESEAHQDHVDANDAAAEAAGLPGVPQTFVFVDGEWVTAVGNEDFEALQSAVESHD